MRDAADIFISTLVCLCKLKIFLVKNIVLKFFKNFIFCAIYVNIRKLLQNVISNFFSNNCNRILQL